MLLVVGVAAIWLRPPPADIGTVANRAVAVALEDGRTVAGFVTGRGPAAVEAADGSVWVANVDAGTLTRWDGDEPSTIGQVGSRPMALATAGGLVWVADPFADEVMLLSQRDGTFVGRLALHADALAAGHGSMWASDELSDAVRRIDPRSRAELDVFEPAPGSGPSDIATSDDSVWVAASLSEVLLPLDPRSGSWGGVNQRLRHGAHLGRWSDIWAVSPGTDTASRIDAAAARVAVRAQVCDSPVAVAAVGNGGGAWVACSVERALWHVDHSGTVDQQIPLEAVPSDLALDGDRVWVALRED